MEFNVDIWYSLTMTIDAAQATAKVYVDGVLTNTVTSITVPVARVDGFSIGANERRK